MKTKIEIEKEFNARFNVLENGNADGSFTLEVGDKIESSNERALSYISSLRKNDIESVIKEIRNWLTQWRRDFANRQLEDRKDAFAECYDIEIALSSHLSELNKGR